MSDLLPLRQITQNPLPVAPTTDQDFTATAWRLSFDEPPWENGRMATTDIDWQKLLARHDMIWETAARRWLDGIPLANG